MPTPQILVDFCAVPRKCIVETMVDVYPIYLYFTAVALRITGRINFSYQTQHNNN